MFLVPAALTNRSTHTHIKAHTHTLRELHTILGVGVALREVGAGEGADDVDEGGFGRGRIGYAVAMRCVPGFAVLLLAAIPLTDALSAGNGDTDAFTLVAEVLAWRRFPNAPA